MRVNQAKAAAAGQDVRISGGAATIRQFIEAGRIEEFTLHLAPLLLGAGVRLFEQLSPGRLKLEPTEAHNSPHVTHVTYRVVA